MTPDPDILDRRAYQNARRDCRRLDRICIDCSAPTVDGKRRCAAHLARNAKIAALWRQARRAS